MNEADRKAAEAAAEHARTAALAATVHPTELTHGRPVAELCGALQENLTPLEGLCMVCRYHRAAGDHCYLYERCAGCHDPENPCSVADVLGNGL